MIITSKTILPQHNKKNFTMVEKPKKWLLGQTVNSHQKMQRISWLDMIKETNLELETYVP
jgi:hypothetical protein